MKKLYLLVALLVSFAAFGMQQKETKIIKPILSYIKNDSGVDYVFEITNYQGSPVFSKEIPAHTTQKINKELGLASADLATRIKMRLSVYGLSKKGQGMGRIFQLSADNILQLRKPGGSTYSTRTTVQTGNVYGIEITDSKIEIKSVTSQLAKAKATLQNIIMGRETLTSARNRIPVGVLESLENEITRILQKLPPKIVQ